MIEGLRVLPFWQEVIAAAPKHPQRDCESCVSTQTTTWRQTVRCGLLPRVGSVGGMETRGFPIPDSDYTTDVCPGYTTSLNEVQEVADCWPHWKERTLTEFLEEPPSRDLLTGLAILARANSAWEAHDWKRRTKKPGDA